MWYTWGRYFAEVLYRMKVYFAPLEGITGYIYRNAFHKAFGRGIDKYFSPFISPGVNQPLTPKELRDIHPDNNKGLVLVPQILANNPDDFLLAAKYIKDLGYSEVNLNLGCPSGTVVAKRKGSGLLGDTDLLLRMLDKIYETTDMKISIKTRIGKDDPDEFPEILEIFNRFPVYELIIHPRIRNEFYKGTPNMEMFDYAAKNSRNPLCYNGDIVTKAQFDTMSEKYNDLTGIMIGRGFLQNPFLAWDVQGINVNNMEAKKGQTSKPQKETQKESKLEALKKFHDEVLERYEEYMSGDKPVLFKMKELWCYMINIFDEEKYGKKIKKAEKLSVYKEVVRELFENCSLK